MVTIYSIIPSLRNELGHFFEYNLALSNAAKINSFHHIKIIPKNAQIPVTDDSWHRIIYETDNEKKWKNFKNIYPLIKFFQRIKKNENSIIFLEDFNLIILAVIFIAAFLVRPKAELWLFHRFEYNKTFLHGKAYKFIQFLFEKIFHEVKYLTDSELIKNLNGHFFNKQFHVFPIPHIYFSSKKNLNDNRIKNFWWPGGLIRAEKGLKKIIKIIDLLNESDNINIVVAESAKNILQNTNNVMFIPTNLIRQDYEKWMINSDLILLPYIPSLYRYRTSGIFVEAIAAGSIPVVSKNTWMSYELKKYGLNELALDWDASDIIDQLKFISNDDSIKKKLMIMKQSYEKIHSVENYAFIMKSLLNQNINN